MAIIYTKTDQGLIVTTGTGAPTHTAVAGDRYTNTSNGNTYQYTTGWNLMALSGDFTGGTVSGATIFTNGLTANTISATTYNGGGINNGKLLAITELTASTLATHTVASSTVFTAINCNSDATNRYAKITFTAPTSGIVEIIFDADILFSNSAAVQMVGLNTTTGSTTTPDNGWFRINGDSDASSATYRADFIINGLTPGTIYSYYVMSVCNFSGNLIRCGSRQTGAYVSGADRPSPLRIYVRDLDTTVITTNPSS